MHHCQDQIERATKIQLPTKIVLQRSICHLCPFQCNMSDKQAGRDGSELTCQITKLR